MGGFLDRLFPDDPQTVGWLSALLGQQSSPATSASIMGRGPRHPNVLPAQPRTTSDSLDTAAAYLAPAPNTTYVTILPLATDKVTGDLRLAMPSLLRGAGLGMIDLMRGTAGEPSRPLTDSDIPYADPRMTPNAMTALAFMATPMQVTETAPYLRPLLSHAAEDSMASRSPRMYNPPVKSPRPFGADYPAGAPADAAGKLTADIEGRPLRARWVVGRHVVGGDDQALAPSQYDAISTGLLGGSPKAVAAGELPRGAAGAFGRSSVADMPTRDIRVDRRLSGPVASKVVAHELGQAIDDLAGVIQTDGLTAELRRVYNDLNNPDLATARVRNPSIDPDAAGARPVLRGYGPEMLNYRGEHVHRELIAEAIRAYMADPNYLKTVAPKTAAAIRAAVNVNPQTARTIQLNVAPGLPLGADSSDR